MCVIKRENQIKTPPELESSSLKLESSSPKLESSSLEPLVFSGGKVIWIAFFSLYFSFFSGKIRNEEKNAGPCNHAWPVSAHRAKSPVPQSPSNEARKFTGLENLVPIPSRDSTLRARPAVQIHDYHLYFRSRPDQPIEFIKKNQIFFR